MALGMIPIDLDYESQNQLHVTHDRSPFLIAKYQLRASCVSYRYQSDRAKIVLLYPRRNASIKGFVLLKHFLLIATRTKHLIKFMTRSILVRRKRSRLCNCNHISLDLQRFHRRATRSRVESSDNYDAITCFHMYFRVCVISSRYTHTIMDYLDGLCIVALLWFLL